MKVKTIYHILYTYGQVTFFKNIQGFRHQNASPVSCDMIISHFCIELRKNVLKMDSEDRQNFVLIDSKNQVIGFFSLSYYFHRDCKYFVEQESYTILYFSTALKSYQLHECSTKTKLRPKLFSPTPQAVVYKP